MDGLTEMKEQILAEARLKAEEILQDANAHARQVIEEAEQDAARENVQTEERSRQRKEAGEERARSSAALKKRQMILAAKQKMIQDIIKKAYDEILHMEDASYFHMLEQILEQNVQAKSGQIAFSAKDRDRLPAEFEAKLSAIAKKHGGELVIAKEGYDIDGGFLLIYGGVEENCSIRAIFREKQEEMSDHLHALLF